MHCCRETLNLDIWNCHTEFEIDCRDLGRWFKRDCMRQESQSRNLPVLRFVAMCVLFQSFLWHVGCRSCGEIDLSIDCLERSVENILIG